ncbi:MAG: TIR domain-containing protein [Cyclobacterium sp.]|uniref:TIR domain-containing protein n=1 Tax=Cyclobacterium sp. TaxID=1966343 RepID=UPI003970A443
MIDKVILYKDLGDNLDSEALEKNRSWMVQQVGLGKTFCSIKRNNQGSWGNIGDFSYDGSIFSWYKIPESLPRRKSFISFYHKDDQSYREKFENLFGDLLISKSVNDGDIDSDTSDGYIKQLIQNDYLSDTTVLVVLIGPKTKCRKHIDWEISGALNYKVGDSYSGLLGLKLPTHPDYGTGKATYNLLPARFADNFKSGYAIIRDWTDDRIKLQSYIELAFSCRTDKSDKRDNSRIQMQKNTCE